MIYGVEWFRGGLFVKARLMLWKYPNGIRNNILTTTGNYEGSENVSEVIAKLREWITQGESDDPG